MRENVSDKLLIDPSDPRQKLTNVHKLKKTQGDIFCLLILAMMKDDRNNYNFQVLLNAYQLIILHKIYLKYKKSSIGRERLCWIIFDCLTIQTKFNRFLPLVPCMFWPKKIAEK